MSGPEAKLVPFAGQKSEVPKPRGRTPSPVARLKEQPGPPPAERDFDFDIKCVDVIYAEDEEVFRESTVRVLLNVGFARENIHEAENGNEALHHLAKLQSSGNITSPLVVLLDVRMPGMDGRECALQIQELVKRRCLRREPFVMCVSSIRRQVIVDEGQGNFQIVLPKPFKTSFVDEAVERLRQWWTCGYGRQLAAWKTFDPSTIDFVIADSEPVCRLSTSMAFARGGANTECIHEVECVEELLEMLADAQAQDRTRPLIVLLGQVSWMQEIRSFLDGEGEERPTITREPFLVCTSVDSDRISASPAIKDFHAFMPCTFGQQEAEWCIEFLRLWWLTRGDGHQEDSDAESNASELSLEPED
eukprot:TRINITY_DN23511_c0_g1_i1.p1 TRINITY_DN23511_c0_g1~~TRINITY_DN23511_c0_g1_i1.p1  ORF type:complete len:361 (+),score=74.79 TRINITY_DN23511_c0_g1_i1:79-1161(+)